MISVLEGPFATLWAPILGGSGPRSGRQLERCPDCGSVRGGYPGAHAPHWRGSVVIDCVGRTCVRGVDGYFVALEAT